MMGGQISIRDGTDKMIAGDMMGCCDSEKIGPGRMAEPYPSIPDYNLRNIWDYLNISVSHFGSHAGMELQVVSDYGHIDNIGLLQNKKEKAGDKAALEALKAMHFVLTDYIFLSISKYIDFSIGLNPAENAPEALMAMQQVDTLCPHRLAGSTPSWGDSAYSAGNKEKSIFIDYDSINLSEDEKEKGVFDVTPIVRDILTDYTVCNEIKYIKISMCAISGGEGAVTLMVRERSDEPYLNRCPGSIPGRTDPPLIASIIEIPGKRDKKW
jgi:hypothetical protein